MLIAWIDFAEVFLEATCKYNIFGVRASFSLIVVFRMVRWIAMLVASLFTFNR